MSKPSYAFHAQWLNGPRDVNLQVVQVSTLTQLFRCWFSGILETGSLPEIEKLAITCYTNKEKIKSGSGFTQNMFISILNTHTHTKQFV